MVGSAVATIVWSRAARRSPEQQPHHDQPDLGLGQVGRRSRRAGSGLGATDRHGRQITGRPCGGRPDAPFSRLLPTMTPSGQTNATGRKDESLLILLYLIGFVAGIVAGISPCILPVLPIILVAGVARPPRHGPAVATVGARPPPAPSAPGAPRRRTPTRRQSGVGRRRDGPRLTESLPGLRRHRRPRPELQPSFTLAGTALLTALRLPQDFLRDAGLVILGLVALGLIVTPLGELARTALRPVRPPPAVGELQRLRPRPRLGVLVHPLRRTDPDAPSPPSAPRSRVGLADVVLTVVFACGAAVPLLAFALAGQRVAERVAAFRRHAKLARQIGGGILAVMTLVLAANWTNGLQTDVPGYTSALQRTIEGGSYAKKQLDALGGHLLDRQAGQLPGGNGARALRPGPGLHRHHRLAQHPGRQARQPWPHCGARWSWSTSGPTPASTASGHCPTSKPGTAATTPTVSTSSGSTPGVRLRTRGVERGDGRPSARGALPHRHRQQPRHLQRLQEQVLAGRLPHRRHRTGAEPGRR